MHLGTEVHLRYQTEEFHLGIFTTVIDGLFIQASDLLLVGDMPAQLYSAPIIPALRFKKLTKFLRAPRTPLVPLVELGHTELKTVPVDMFMRLYKIVHQE
jgi:hypothetical protein